MDSDAFMGCSLVSLSNSISVRTTAGVTRARTHPPLGLAARDEDDTRTRLETSDGRTIPSPPRRPGRREPGARAHRHTLFEH